MKKFLNTAHGMAVFMIEGRRVLAAEATLSGATVTTERVQTEKSRFEASPIDSNQIACSEDEAVEALVRQHSRLVYRIAYAILRRHHDAEDATQETFMRVLRYKSKLAKVEDPKAWLARIAWRVAVDRGKRQGRTRETSLDDPEQTVPEVASSDVAADASVQGAQLGSELEKMIAALPEKLRQPLVLSTIEEMSPREIAATLGINEAAVRSRVFRARQILRERLEQRTGRR